MGDRRWSDEEWRAFRANMLAAVKRLQAEGVGTMQFTNSSDSRRVIGIWPPTVGLRLAQTPGFEPIDAEAMCDLEGLPPLMSVEEWHRAAKS